MNKFDSVIQEALGDIFDAAKGAYNFNLTRLPDFMKKFQNNKDVKTQLPKNLEQKKFELKFVTSDMANKALQESKTPQSTSTTTKETSTARIFSPTAVIMEKVGTLEGLVGEIVDIQQNPLLNLFNNQLNQIVNQDENKKNDIDVKRIISQTGTFWVQLTDPRPNNESFDNIINYQSQIINEEIYPDLQYATWFIFETDNSTYLHKFKITKTENAPDIKLGKAFRLDNNRGKPTGLIQVGQGTLYPRWYFLNDLIEKKGPTGIKEPENYTGDIKIS
jgi:hypothetical protein